MRVRRRCRGRVAAVYRRPALPGAVWESGAPGRATRPASPPGPLATRSGVADPGVDRNADDRGTDCRCSLRTDRYPTVHGRWPDPASGRVGLARRRRRARRCLLRSRGTAHCGGRRNRDDLRDDGERRHCRRPRRRYGCRRGYQHRVSRVGRRFRYRDPGGRILPIRQLRFSRRFHRGVRTGHVGCRCRPPSRIGRGGLRSVEGHLCE